MAASSSLCAQQTDFLRFLSGSVTVIDDSTSQLRLAFEIDSGLHIQSNQPELDTVIPTRIGLVLPEELVMEATRFPHPETMYLEGSNQPLKVFSGRLEALIRIRHLQPLQQLNQITGTIYFQACNDQRCFYPRELGFEVSVPD
jgi:hypothetical protein